MEVSIACVLLTLSDTSMWREIVLLQHCFVKLNSTFDTNPVINRLLGALSMCWRKKIICSLSPLFLDTACSHQGIKYIKLLFLSSAANLSKASYTVACFVQHAPWNDRQLSAHSQRKVGCWLDLRAKRNEVMMPRTQPAIEVNRLSQTTHPWMHMETYT